MKVLLDQNLSRKLCIYLESSFEEIKHVSDFGLERAMDSDIWNFAIKEDFIIISKDSDFYQRSITLGFPPKVIWVRSGNSSTFTIAQKIKQNLPTIEVFFYDPESSFLVIP